MEERGKGIDRQTDVITVMEVSSPILSSWRLSHAGEGRDGGLFRIKQSTSLRSQSTKKTTRTFLCGRCPDGHRSPEQVEMRWPAQGSPLRVFPIPGPSPPAIDSP